MPSTKSIVSARSVDAADSMLSPAPSEDWDRRRSSPVGNPSSSYSSFNPAPGSRVSILSPPPTPRNSRLGSGKHDLRLRSNSGLSLHTNDSALRKYTDYNPDGSVRSSQYSAPASSMSRSDYYDSITSGSVGYRSSVSWKSTASMPIPALPIPDFFSRTVIQMALDDPTTFNRLLKFAQNRKCGENLDFYVRIQEYTKTLNSLTALMTSISTTYTSRGATVPLDLPSPLFKALNQDFKHISTSVLPNLEALFLEPKAYIQERIATDIYPAFVKHQLSLCTKTSLAADSGLGSSIRAEFPGLGEAFCLTDPQKPDNPVVYASDSFVEITGYARHEVIPFNCRFLQGGMTDGATASRIREAIEKNEEVSELIINYGKDGQPFWNLLFIAPLVTANGKVRHFLGGQVNVSETLGRDKDILGMLNFGSLREEAAQSEVSGKLQRLTHQASHKELHPLERETSKTSLHSKTSSAKAVSKGFFSSLRSKVPDVGSRSQSRQQQSEAALEGGSGAAASTPTFNGRQQQLQNSLCGSIDDSSTAYSRYMILQYMPASSERAPPQRPITPGSRMGGPSGGGSSTTRLPVTYSSRLALETLGLGPAAQDAVLYHDVFSVLSEFANSPSITKSFKSQIHDRLSQGRTARAEILVSTFAKSSGSVPLGGNSSGGSSVGTGAGGSGPLAGFFETDEDATITLHSSRRQSLVGISDRDSEGGGGRKLAKGERGGGGGGQVHQKLLSYWTPLKDAEGRVAWVVLLVTPATG